MKVAIAIDSFKGSLSSMQAGAAAAAGIRRAIPEAECLVRPLADGGEGTVEALADGLGGEIIEVAVTGPMGRTTVAKYALVGELAIMEMAQASGITLVPPAERNPLVASTRGTGEMILDALRQGAKKFIMGIGGSATNDGGCGMLDVLREAGALAKCRAADFQIACDVKNPLCGPNGASAVFGPQKGATPAMVRELDARLAAFAAASGDPGLTPGDGAAGGLGYGLRVHLGARLTPGVELILRETQLERYVREAEVVVTGEGRLDGQTVMGKAPIGVAALAKKHGKRVVAFAGCLGDGVEQVNAAGIDAFFPVLRRVTTLDAAMATDAAAANLTATAEQVFRAVAAMRGIMV